jgi:glycosyltransferase involved in cell wall biosynthesis
VDGDRQPMSRPVRILRVITRLNIGGPAVHVLHLHDHTAGGRYETRMVAGIEETSEGSYLALHRGMQDGITVLPSLGREIRPWRDVEALVGVVREIRRFRPDIVETHTAKAGVIGRVAAALCRVPVTLHVYHGHVLHGYFPPAPTRAFVEIERRLARHTSCLLAVSDQVRSDLLSLGIGTKQRFEVMPLGLDLERFRSIDTRRGELRAELGLGTAPLVGIVARLAPVKAHDVFLRAAAALRARRPEVRFVVVGDGELRASLEALAAGLGLQASITFLGWRSDVERVYADLDLLVLSSRNEGSPIALIEAMASGRNVVATAVGGVPDVVRHGETGLLVNPDDHDALARSMEELLLANPERRAAMATAARNDAFERFGLARLLADIDRLYAALLP